MKRTLLPGLLGAAIMLAGCGSDDDTSAPAASPTAAMAVASATVPGDMVSIDVKGFTYAPKMIEVPVGTTITWTNADQILHTVTSGAPDGPDGQFDGQMPAAGDSTSYTFEVAGSVTYFCTRHPFMRGEVVVR